MIFVTSKYPKLLLIAVPDRWRRFTRLSNLSSLLHLYTSTLWC